MVFSSTLFLFLFLPLTLMIYYNPFVRSRKFRNRCLLVASLFFYAWGEPFFVWLMVLPIAVGWACGRAMERAASRRQEKRILTAGVVFHVGLLFVFQYLMFAASQLGLLLHEDFSAIHIALPIGISFFTFQLLSYLFDIYYGRSKAQQSVLAVGLYIALFPQLIAGPIVRYETIEQQIEHRVENIADFSSGMMCFIYGLGKKVVIANYMGVVADNIFDGGGSLSLATAWYGAFAYTLQIYFDFSGYSDMAIGFGRMFGFHFMENFNYPYISRSATEFWRRWHISLGTWFRDYVYIPLGGNRVTRRRWGYNLFVVWALTGIWHGANWTFLCWGLWYFVLLLVEKLTGFPEKLGRSRMSTRCWPSCSAGRCFRQGSRHGGELHRRDAGDGVRRHCGCDVLLLSHQFLFRVCGSRFAFPAHRSLSAEEGGVPARGAGSRDRYFCALARADREFLVQSVHLFQFLRNR